jgi:predicted membrane protein
MTRTKKLTISGLLIALGIILPFVTAQVPAFGQALLPMHFPAIIAGFVLGPVYGAAIGFIIPLLRFVLVGMPAMPFALIMAVELFVYGLITGLLKPVNTDLAKTYFALLVAMFLGRVAWGVMMLILTEAPVTVAFVVANTFTSSLVGIIIQLVTIPLIVNAIKK